MLDIVVRFFMSSIIALFSCFFALQCVNLHVSAQACNVGHFEMVKTLLDAGANPNFAGKSGKLPLYVASKNQKPGNLEILELLIARGANVNGKHVNGKLTFCVVL